MYLSENKFLMEELKKQQHELEEELAHLLLLWLCVED